jgi:hypothetical protein
MSYSLTYSGTIITGITGDIPSFLDLSGAKNNDNELATEIGYWLLIINPQLKV